MRDGFQSLRERGAGLVVVLCQKPEVVRAHFAAHPVPFLVAIDARREAARAYGVYTLLGLDSINIARPATFVLDGEGIVRRRFVARFQWQRLPLAAVLDALDQLRSR